MSSAQNKSPSYLTLADIRSPNKNSIEQIKESPVEVATEKTEPIFKMKKQMVFKKQELIGVDQVSNINKLEKDNEQFIYKMQTI